MFHNKSLPEQLKDFYCVEFTGSSSDVSSDVSRKRRRSGNKKDSGKNKIKQRLKTDQR